MIRTWKRSDNVWSLNNDISSVRKQKHNENPCLWEVLKNQHEIQQCHFVGCDNQFLYLKQAYALKVYCICLVNIKVERVEYGGRLQTLIVSKLCLLVVYEQQCAKCTAFSFDISRIIGIPTIFFLYLSGQLSKKIR